MRDPFRRRQITHHGLASEGIGLKCSGKWSNSLIAIHLSALLFGGGGLLVYPRRQPQIRLMHASASWRKNPNSRILKKRFRSAFWKTQRLQC